MQEAELPSSWVDLLREANDQPEGILSLIGTDVAQETELVAEQLTDRGFFRVASAKRYQLTDAGREVLARSPRTKQRTAFNISGWLSRLLSQR